MKFVNLYTPQSQQRVSNILAKCWWAGYLSISCSFAHFFFQCVYHLTHDVLNIVEIAVLYYFSFLSAMILWSGRLYCSYVLPTASKISCLKIILMLWIISHVVEEIKFCFSKFFRDDCSKSLSIFTEGPFWIVFCQPFY